MEKLAQLVVNLQSQMRLQTTQLIEEITILRSDVKLLQTELNTVLDRNRILAERLDVLKRKTQQTSDDYIGAMGNLATATNNINNQSHT